jgi:hypothetical protein
VIATDHWLKITLHARVHGALSNIVVEARKYSGPCRRHPGRHCPNSRVSAAAELLNPRLWSPSAISGLSADVITRLNSPPDAPA